MSTTYLGYALFMAISILMIIPTATDATSFYRAAGPFGRLRNRYGGVRDINLVFTERYDWSVFSMVDICFMQRPFTAQHQQVAEMSKKCGVPLWLDYDDDLFQVPTDNPTFAMYGNAEVQKCVATMTAMADAVSVSTPYLKERLLKLNSKMHVIPNAFDDRMLRLDTVDRNKPKNKLVFWRGSHTHQRDLMSVAQEIISHSHQFKDVTYNFAGYLPWFLTDQMRKNSVVVSGAMDLPDYFKFLQTIQPGISMVPLYPGPFNMSKSNIAWQEASFAGAATLVPKWSEWEKPGAIAYEDHKDFGNKLRAMCSGEVDLVKHANQSWDYIRSELMLDKINLKRLQIIQDLLA